MSGKVLFACSKCFSRHPFEELSSGQQLCKGCRGPSCPVVKCTYCRSEYQQPSKSASSVCKKCEQNLKQHGKPTACECCNIIAAFGSSKCLRCASSIAKYGQPVACDQCKQRSAFDRRDENKKINGKLLCYLCTCSYKRALAKAHQVDKDARASKKRTHEKPMKDIQKKVSRTEIAPKPSSGSASASIELPEKVARSSANSGNGSSSVVGISNFGTMLDSNSSDHLVAMTQLKEQIASMQRKLAQKDRELLEKDKQLTELKSKNFDNEKEMRTKLKEVERISEIKIDIQNKKIATLLKEVATLNRNNKKNGSANKDKDSLSAKDSGGSGTDSPSTN